MRIIDWSSDVCSSDLLSLHRRYRALRDRPRTEQWNGLTVLRPRFTLIPRYGARFNPAAVARAFLPASRGRRFDVVDAQFFYPDGPAAMRVAEDRKSTRLNSSH